MSAPQEKNDARIEKKKKKDPLAREGLVPEWKQPEPYFESSEGAAEKMARYGFNKPWRVMPDDKKEPVHKKASTKGALVAVHPDAIVIGTEAGAASRKWDVPYLFIIGPLTLMFYFMAYKFEMPRLHYYDKYMNELLDNPHFGTQAFLFISSILAAALGTFFVIFMWRNIFHTPPDYPILFNRKTRIVTFFKRIQPSFFKFWKPIIVSNPISLSWDDAKIRTYRVFMSRFGKTFYYALWLQMLWGGKDGNPKRLKDYIAVGFEGYEEDDGLLQLWEHIRRYMEEDGPPIQPGERLRKPANKRKPLEFPPEIIAAAGGPALSEAEVLALAELPTEQAAGA